jgi:arginyl-tRNA synthetase
MKEKIIIILKSALGADAADIPIELSIPEEPAFGHFSTNVAMRLAKVQGKKPMALAAELVAKVEAAAPAGFFEKVEAAAPGFINFRMSENAIQGEFMKIAKEKGFGKNKNLTGKTVMVEYTDPNPFKLFHIGHLMSNTIGESFARLYEASGAKVIRANYQGDVGLHVAKAIWGMEHHGDAMPSESVGVLEKMEFLGKAYAFGSQSYENDPQVQSAIIAINEKVYSRSDAEVNKLYDAGRAWSLAYFETLYKRLGTKFDHYFFEGEMAKEGMAIVSAHQDIFVKSDGAIVFPGEKYGLHTRVFVSSKGLPTYESKELGLNKKKFELYPLDRSIIVTGNEIIDYFKVLLKAMALVLPEVAAKTRHVPHGMLRLSSGKMSSRTGDVVTAEVLLGQVKEVLRARVSEKSDLNKEEREAVTEAIAIGAIKYSILKQNPGQDIIFDFEKSLSFEGDAGPYVQYAYARLKSILRKSKLPERKSGEADLTGLNSEIELALMRRISEFPAVISHARELYAPSGLVVYVYKLASLANKFYETTPILKDENMERLHARLVLVEIAAQTLKSGLGLLGIATPEKI